VGLATPALAAPTASTPATDGVAGGVTPTAVAVNFAAWGSIFLAPGASQSWWFTWIFDGNRWSRMSAVPLNESPAGSTVQIVSEWAAGGTLWVTFRNNSNVGVVFRPTAIAAPV